MGVKCVGKAKVSDNDVSVAIQEQVFQLKVTMDDALLVEVANSGDQLGEETAR